MQTLESAERNKPTDTVISTRTYKQQCDGIFLGPINLGSSQGNQMFSEGGNADFIFMGAVISDININTFANFFLGCSRALFTNSLGLRPGGLVRNRFRASGPKKLVELEECQSLCQVTQDVFKHSLCPWGWKEAFQALTYERLQEFITKIHANSRFNACTSFLRCFRKENLRTCWPFPISFSGVHLILEIFRQEWRICGISIFALFA